MLIVGNYCKTTYKCYNRIIMANKERDIEVYGLAAQATRVGRNWPNWGAKGEMLVLEERAESTSNCSPSIAIKFAGTQDEVLITPEGKILPRIHVNGVAIDVKPSTDFSYYRYFFNRLMNPPAPMLGGEIEVRHS